MPAIIVKNYEHFNRSLPNWDTPKGKYIKTKDQYDRAMKEAGMISYEEMNRIVESNKNKEKKYVPSAKAIGILKAAMSKKDRNGNVKPDGRTIEAMKDMKAVLPKVPDYMKLPSVYSKKGGFNE